MYVSTVSKMEQTREIVRSFHTIVEMIRDRKLYPNIDELVEFRDAQLSAFAAGNKTIFSLDFPSCSMRIVYNMYPKFKVNDVKKLLAFSGIVILVAREKPGTLALKGLEGAAKDNVQVFDIKELQFNVARHSLVPLHEPVRDEDDIAAIIAASSVKSKMHLPLIHSSDPMARYLALKPGELVRIHRLSPSAGEYVSYRCCIKV